MSAKILTRSGSEKEGSGDTVIAVFDDFSDWLRIKDGEAGFFKDFSVESLKEGFAGFNATTWNGKISSCAGMEEANLLFRVNHNTSSRIAEEGSFGG